MVAVPAVTRALTSAGASGPTCWPSTPRYHWVLPGRGGGAAGAAVGAAPGGQCLGELGAEGGADADPHARAGQTAGVGGRLGDGGGRLVPREPVEVAQHPHPRAGVQGRLHLGGQRHVLDHEARQGQAEVAQVLAEDPGEPLGDLVLVRGQVQDGDTGGGQRADDAGDHRLADELVRPRRW